MEPNLSPRGKPGLTKLYIWLINVSSLRSILFFPNLQLASMGKAFLTIRYISFSDCVTKQEIGKFLFICLIYFFFYLSCRQYEAPWHKSNPTDDKNVQSLMPLHWKSRVRAKAGANWICFLTAVKSTVRGKLLWNTNFVLTFFPDY